MDLLMIALRITHFVAGIVWVGYGMFMLYLLVPTARKLGAEGENFMQEFLKHSRFSLVMPLASLLTTAAGLWLYYKVSNGFNSDWMGSDGGIVLSIGVVAGLFAFGHGGATTGPITSRIGKLSEELDALTELPTDEQLAHMSDLQRKMRLHGQISVSLMVISVIGMASARYM